MRNKAVMAMVLTQFDWDLLDTKLEFIGIVGDEEIYEITNYSELSNTKLEIKISTKITETLY